MVSDVPSGITVTTSKAAPLRATSRFTKAVTSAAGAPGGRCLHRLGEGGAGRAAGVVAGPVEHRPAHEGERGDRHRHRRHRRHQGERGDQPGPQAGDGEGPALGHGGLGAGATSLYPTPRTVWMSVGLAGSSSTFDRRRWTHTSTSRESPR